jgi:hypothetical protein
MGMNYYVIENHCEHCNRGDELHIGKSSYGWCFSLCYNEERNLTSLEDWKTFLQDKRIVDEDGSRLTAEEMVKVITDRKSARENPITDKEVQDYGLAGMHGYRDVEEFYRQNHAEPGPNNLLRHQIFGGLCIAHGEGTWDMLKGEFS